MDNPYYIITIFIIFPILSIGLWRTLQLLERNKNADWGGPILNGLSGLNRLLCYRYHRLSGDRIKLPATGGAIVVSNHVSGLDAMLLIAASDRPLRFIIAKEQYDRFGLQWLFRSIGCIPVERQAKPERAFREALRQLSNGEVIALFPHGKIHLDSDPPRPLKGGVVRLAQLSGCPIYAVRIDGIKGQGHAVMSVPIRSNAVLTTREPIYHQSGGNKECLAEVALHIETSAIN